MVSQYKCSKQSINYLRQGVGSVLIMNNVPSTQSHIRGFFFQTEACAVIQNIKQKLIHVTWLCNKMSAYIVCTMYPSYFTEAMFLAVTAKKAVN